MTASADLEMRMIATRSALAAYECTTGDLMPAAARIAWVRAEGVRGILAYQVEGAEHERRRQAGLGAVTRLDWLDVLMALPLGLPLAPRSLTDGERALVRRLPSGCIERAGDGLIRRLTHPIRMCLAIVEDPDWRRGLIKSGAYVGCTRILVVPPEVTDLDDAALEAGYWGVGLMTSGRPRGALRVIVAPQRYVPQVHTAAAWRFCEEMYRQAVVTGGEGQ